jgi:hypothetical protein
VASGCVKLILRLQPLIELMVLRPCPCKYYFKHKMSDDARDLFNIEIDEFNKKAKVTPLSQLVTRSGPNLQRVLERA